MAARTHPPSATSRASTPPSFTEPQRRWSSHHGSADPPSLFQVIALAWTYRRLVRVWSYGPLRAVVVPTIAVGIFGLFNWLLGGLAVVVLLQTWGLVELTDRIVRALATSKESLDASLSKNVLRVPLVAFLGSCWTTFYLVGPFFRGLRLDVLAWSFPPKAMLHTLTLSLRVAVAMALLGLAVVGRYIGPNSIMRCSSVPLLINPLDDSIRTLCWKPSSLMLPGDGTGDLLFARRRGMAGVPFVGMRFQHASWRTLLSQIVATVFLGMIVAWSCVWTILVPPTHNSAGTAVVVATVLATMLPLVGVLDFVSHELSPRTYYYPTASIHASKTSSRWSAVMRQVLFVAVTSPLVSLVVAAYWSNNTNLRNGIREFLPLALLCGLIAWYVVVLDNAIRAALLDPTCDLDRWVEELCDQAAPAALLEVMLHTLLFSASEAQDASLPPPTPARRHGGDGCDARDEMRRIQAQAQILSHRLLGSPAGLDHGSSGAPEAPLEEDMLRMCVWNAMGGESGSAWRIATLAEWFGPKCPVGPDHEPLCLPLMRGLCVHVRGLGEALLVCTSPVGRGSWLDGRSLEPWSLPPGLLFAAESSVRALAWCMVQSMMYRGQPISDWKSSWLSNLLPVALTSIFHLRRGILAFPSEVAPTLLPNEPASGTTGVLVANASPESTIPLVRVCDNAGRSILEALHLPKGLGRIQLPLDEDCYLWTKQLLLVTGESTTSS